MTPEEKQALKEKIVADLEKTRQDIEDLKEQTKPIAPENSIGRISRMDAINNKSVNEASLRVAKEKLPKLEKALEKIDEKDFGLCARCKNPIPVPRLMLMPESTRCIHCVGK